MSYKILIAEDDKDLSLMYSTKFHKEWFEVRVAYDGLSAISQLTDFAPDVLLLDIMMPSMDGFETLRVIRDLAPSSSTKIVVFSNLNGPADIKRCMELGADEYLLKANTTPKGAVERVLELIGKDSDEPDADVATAGVPSGSSSERCPCCGQLLPRNP